MYKMRQKTASGGSRAYGIQKGEPYWTIDWQPRGCSARRVATVYHERAASELMSMLVGEREAQLKAQLQMSQHVLDSVSDVVWIPGAACSTDALEVCFTTIDALAGSKGDVHAHTVDLLDVIGKVAIVLADRELSPEEAREAAVWHYGRE